MTIKTATYNHVAALKPGSRVLVVQNRSAAYGGARLHRATLRRITKTRVIVDVIFPTRETPLELRFLYNPKGYRETLDRVEGESVFSNSSWRIVAPESEEAAIAHFAEKVRKQRMQDKLAGTLNGLEKIRREIGGAITYGDPDKLRDQLRTELAGALAQVEAL